MVITRCLLDCTLDAIRLRQGGANDIANGIHIIGSLKSLVTAIRNSIDKYHIIWYSKVLELKVNVVEKKPKTCGRQIHRGNAPSDNVPDYYRMTVTIPIVDHLNTELNQRFGTDCTNAYFGLSLISEKLVSMVNNPSTRKEREI